VANESFRADLIGMHFFQFASQELLRLALVRLLRGFTVLLPAQVVSAPPKRTAG